MSPIANSRPLCFCLSPNILLAIPVLTDCEQLGEQVGVFENLARRAVGIQLPRADAGEQSVLTSIRPHVTARAIMDSAYVKMQKIMATYTFTDPRIRTAAEGFFHVRTCPFDQICLALTGTYERARKFRFQHLAAMSRGSPLTL